MDALRSDLALYLGFESGDPRAPSSPDVSINRLNGHITVKVGFRWSEDATVILYAERNYIVLTHITGLEKTRDPQVPY